MNDLIEKLKDKTYVRAFGLMSPEEQECFKKVGVKNCYVYCKNIGWVDVRENGFEYTALTYAIKPNYKLEPVKHLCCGTIYCQYCYPDKPEPEFVDLKIELDITRKWLGVNGTKYKFLPFCFMNLNCLPSLPNFAGFYLMKGGHGFVGIDYVADKISEGKKIYARFRKRKKGRSYEYRNKKFFIRV